MRISMQAALMTVIMVAYLITICKLLVVMETIVGLEKEMKSMKIQLLTSFFQIVVIIVMYLMTVMFEYRDKYRMIFSMFWYCIIWLVLGMVTTVWPWLFIINAHWHSFIKKQVIKEPNEKMNYSEIFQEQANRKTTERFTSLDLKLGSDENGGPSSSPKSSVVICDTKSDDGIDDIYPSSA